MIRIVLKEVPASERIPRESGDDPVVLGWPRIAVEYSPRERG